MSLSDFDYPLPKELIAQSPISPRDHSRLLVADRKSVSLSDKYFYDLSDLVPPGDCLVLNDTKVFQARLVGHKKLTGGKVEILLLEQKDNNAHLWRCLIQPVLKEGQEIVLDAAEAVFVKRDTDGIALVEFKDVDVANLAKKIGTMPLPPYIKRNAEKIDEETYQTVFAKHEGAVAAPTAGLHFTPQLLKKMENKGIKILYVTLHVGYGTFKPVEDLEGHRMHAENFELTQAVADQLNTAKSEKRGIWAVGTTALRVLETCVQNKKVIAGNGYTDLYIKSPFEFETVDHLITNFHLPKTTLLLLVSAFMGESLRKKAYEHAVQNKYRFYSYGDAMCIL